MNDTGKLYAITTESLTTWAANYQDQEKWGDCLAQMPGAMLDEWNEVRVGRAVLRTPDGRQWWVPVSGSMGAIRTEGEVAEALVDYVVDHKCLAHGQGPSLPIIVWDRRTLDPSQVFCGDCCRFVNLSAEARVFDDAGTRVPDDEGEG